MANTKLEGKSKIKAFNNTTGSVSFKGVDDKKYLLQQAGSYRLIELSIIEGLYNECSGFITKGYIYFEDKRVYDYLGIPEEVYSKIIPIKELDAFLEKSADEIKQELDGMSDVMKENVATVAKKKNVDSKSKVKAIKDATGFEVDTEEKDE
jgi:flagellin-specific chaperone FliS